MYNIVFHSALFISIVCSACGVAPRRLVLVEPTPVPPTLLEPVSVYSQAVEPVATQQTIESTPLPSLSQRRTPLVNVYLLGKSNYVDLFSEYFEVESRIIEFANDSKRLDPLSILALRDLSKRFVEGRNIVSVIGCSIGKTSLRNGNLRLSQSRTNVIKDELLFHDVPLSAIYDELCWGKEKLEAGTLPTRGARVTLMQKR